MRILYHHRTRGRSVEGVHIRGIVDALRAMGHEVTILSFPGADPEAPEEGARPRPGRAQGVIRWVTTRLPEWAFEALELVYNGYTWPRLSRAARRTGPWDLIYERYSLFLFATVLWARRRGIPVVLEINDSALLERVRPLSWRRLARAIEGRVLRAASGRVFISRAFRETAEAAYGDLSPAVISPNAADATVFDPTRYDREAIRADYGLAGRVVAGYVGAFVAWHGIHPFVEAILPRLRERPELVLLLVGDGERFPAIAEAVEAAGLTDQVRLTGRVAHGEVPALMAAMDFAILPDSNTYGSPMKVFEFMAMGLGVVAPDYGPLTEVIADGETGWLFPAGDIDAGMERALAVAGDEVERLRVGAAAADYIRRERQWQDNAAALLALVPDAGEEGQ